jgi:PAS domain S-box-containing protein
VIEVQQMKTQPARVNEADQAGHSENAGERRPKRSVHAFGSFLLHTKPLRLVEGRRIVRLPARQLQVLSMIVGAQGGVVPKHVLLETVWHDAAVEEGSLTQTVFLIRRALGRLPDGGEIIETVPRQGYRLASAALHPEQQEREAHEIGPASGGLSALGMHEGDQFRLLVESIEDYAIYMLDCAGRVVTWNPGAEKNKGYTSQEVIGQHFSIFFVPEDIDARIPDRELAIAATKAKCVGEGWRIRKNGERFWASFVITAMRSPTGKLLGFAKVVRDLTERKRQEDALRRMEALLRRERDRLHAAAESSMDAFYICEAVRDQNGEVEDFVFTYLNKNVEKTVSLPREVLLGGKMCELLPVNREQGFFEHYKRVLLTGEPYTAEFPVDDKNVTSEWIRVQAVALEDGVAITESDITQWKRG